MAFRPLSAEHLRPGNVSVRESFRFGPYLGARAFAPGCTGVGAAGDVPFKNDVFQKLSYVDADFRRFLLASCAGLFPEQIFPRRIDRARLESANLGLGRRLGLLFATSECTGAQNRDFSKPVGSACVFGFEMTAKKLDCTGKPNIRPVARQPLKRPFRVVQRPPTPKRGFPVQSNFFAVVSNPNTQAESTGFIKSTFWAPVHGRRPPKRRIRTPAHRNAGVCGRNRHIFSGRNGGVGRPQTLAPPVPMHRFPPAPY